jgi:hypothetical protein
VSKILEQYVQEAWRQACECGRSEAVRLMRQKPVTYSERPDDAPLKVVLQ